MASPENTTPTTCLPPAARYNWIEAYLRRGGTGGTRMTVDVLNQQFVSDYLDATGAACKVMPYGADKCPQLGRDLGQMTKDGRLRRATIGVNGTRSEGFPSWVYLYALPEA